MIRPKKEDLEFQPIDIHKLINPITPSSCHPISTGQYIIPTSEITKMFQKVKSMIEDRSPGGIIYGRPRIGKTRALKYLLNVLPSLLGADIPIFSAVCNRHTKPNEDVFFKELLTDFNHAFASNGKATEKRERIVNLFIERGERSGQRRVVLFLDEADRLSSLHYDWLMDIYNRVDNAEISMTVISVGQLALQQLRSSFAFQQKAQIIGRFMVNEHQYRGMTSANEIKACLHGYDTAEFPDNSKCSYTKFFYPEAFERGERFSGFCNDLYNAFLNLRLENGLSKKFDIPMQYIANAIENIMKHHGALGEGVYWPTVSHWNIAVKKSGYLESEILMDLLGTKIT
ncbi:ATP-binding protein [Paenibacillus eucommiae]|uniref:Type II secretory pathway predicted ATPase ExeA n=1 Tax=Paenibacillus eucommiae TaxID=1355755 RepID=A0ABS4IUC2_9BACL|nr:ATP-binding protein [Paenibacillus eucommiae]MBP1991191.1 type II secretory pathway predicted ATPase ExeA [Paenibacillus eucommiae]